MPLRYSNILDIMLQRMERLGLVDQESNQADAAEAELYLFQALLDIVEIADIPAYTHYEPALTITTVGQPNYTLPDNFGRLILPRVRNRRGFYAFDDLSLIDLEYLDPNTFSRQTSMYNGRPAQFTVMENALWLFPTPDANSLHNYVIKGSYIVKAEKPELTDPVLLSYPTALIDVALFRLGSDAGKDISALVAQRNEALTRLVQGSR